MMRAIRVSRFRTYGIIIVKYKQIPSSHNYPSTCETLLVHVQIVQIRWFQKCDLSPFTIRDKELLVYFWWRRTCCVYTKPTSSSICALSCGSLHLFTCSVMNCNGWLISIPSIHYRNLPYSVFRISILTIIFLRILWMVSSSCRSRSFIIERSDPSCKAHFLLTIPDHFKWTHQSRQ